MTTATELNRKRATVKPEEAKRWNEAANGNGHHDDEESFEATDSNGTPPVSETTNGRERSKRQKPAPATAAADLGDKPRQNSTAAADVRKIPLTQLVQHPANPDPSESDIVETMAWLQAGQLEPLIVRSWDLHDDFNRGEFQVLAGKRRCLAAARLGWKEIECRVRADLHDEQSALAVMAATNAQRHVETPIRQAQMLKAMIDAGMSHEDAGKIYGLESKSGVVNKLRLLQLPAVWHERLASAEISERVVRSIIPYTASPTLMKLIDKEWKEDQRDSYSRESWHADEIAYTLLNIVEKHTRPIDTAHKHDYGWQLGNNHPRYFELTPELEAKLNIVELPIGEKGAAVKVATNIAKYDELQLPLVEAKAKKKNGQQEKPKKSQPKKVLTPAQLKAKRKEQDEQTAGRVHDWRHRFLRCAASGRVQAGDWRTGLILPWLMQQTGRGGYTAAPLDGFLHDALVMMNACNGRGRTWSIANTKQYHTELALADVIAAVDADGDPVREVEEAQMSLCVWLLWPATNVGEMKDKLHEVNTEGKPGDRLPQIDDEDLEALCGFLHVDMKNAWDNLAHNNAFGKHLLEEFFALHTKDQLADLVEELKIDDMDCKSKGDLVAAFCNQHTSKKPLALPKAIAPLAAAGKPKKGAKKR